MAWVRVLLQGDAAVLTDTPPVNVDHAVAAQGTAGEASRQDHKHDLNEGLVATLAPVDGTAAALGTDDAVPHLDHVHDLGPLVAALDFDQQQAVSLVLEAVDTPPDAAAEVEGQIYFDTGVADKHPYVWVA
jgi:hypothetical protein